MFVRKFAHLLNCYRRLNDMYRDEIIEEVWKNRETYAASHNHDLTKIVDDLMARQKPPGKIVVDRRPVPDDDTNSDKVATRLRAGM